MLIKASLLIFMLMIVFETGVDGTLFPNCADWESLSDKKCLIVVEEMVSEEEAKAKCRELDRKSTLITIESETEQKSLIDHLKSYKNTSNDFWIGLEYEGTAFKWVDGTPLTYENWGQNAIKDGTLKCVHISVTDYEEGAWTDDMCQRGRSFVCQKKIWSIWGTITNIFSI